MKIQDNPKASLLSTGIAGLDNILGGGLTKDRIYLIEGEPGTGKTTTGLQFLVEGVRQDESVVYITLAETGAELRGVGESHGWDMQGIHIQEVLPSGPRPSTPCSTRPRWRWVPPCN